MRVLYELREGGVKISEIVAEEDKKKGKALERERKRDLVCWVAFQLVQRAVVFFFFVLWLLQSAATERECFLLAY